MKKLLVCKECNRRIGCMREDNAVIKCYHCGVMDCPFEEGWSDYYTKAICEGCQKKEKRKK